MERRNGIIMQLQRPPTRSNLSIFHIIQIIIMLFIGILKTKQLYLNLKSYNFSFTDSLIIVSDGLILLGILNFVYGLLAENSKFLKIGLLIFVLASLFFFVFSVFSLFKEKSLIKCLLELIMYGFIIYVIYLQIPNI